MNSNIIPLYAALAAGKHKPTDEKFRRAVRAGGTG